jgi:hypothetical protein
MVRITVGRSGYYDIYGMPISMERWTQLFGQVRHVGDERLMIKGREYHVSTVWLGLDHSFGYGPPLIFETMIFPADGKFDELYQDRYTTMQQAREGHWRAKRWLYKQLGAKAPVLIHKGRKP